MSDKEAERIKRRLLYQLAVKRQRRPGCPHPDDTGDLKALARCKVAVVDFWAPWCAPCRLVEPVLERIKDEYGDRIAVARVNVDLHPELAASLDIRGVPTVLVLSKGREKRRIVGYTPTLYKVLKETIDALLATS